MGFRWRRWRAGRCRRCVRCVPLVRGGSAGTAFTTSSGTGRLPRFGPDSGGRHMRSSSAASQWRVRLTRWWQAWSKAPPPAELRHLIDNVTLGQGLYLYLPPYSNGLPREGCCDPSEGQRSSACPRDLPGVMFGLNGGECGHYPKPMNTAAPDLGGVLRVHGEVPMSGSFCQPFRPGG